MFSENEYQPLVTFIQDRGSFPFDLLHGQDPSFFEAVRFAETAVGAVVDTMVGTIEWGKEDDSVVVYLLLDGKCGLVDLLPKFRISYLKKRSGFVGAQGGDGKGFLKNIPDKLWIRLALAVEGGKNGLIVNEIFPVNEVFVDLSIADNSLFPIFDARKCHGVLLNCKYTVKSAFGL